MQGFTFNPHPGLLYGGLHLLGCQALTCIAFSAWAALATLALLRGIDLVLPLRAGGQTVPQSCDGSAVPVLEKSLPRTENFQELQMPGRWSVAPQKYAKYI